MEGPHLSSGPHPPAGFFLLGNYLHPTAGAALDIGIIALRVAAIMPVIRDLRLSWNMHDILPLNVNRGNGRCCHYGRRNYGWCISISRGITITAVVGRPRAKETSEAIA